MKITVTAVVIATIMFLFSTQLSQFVNADNLGVYSGLSWVFYLSLGILISLLAWRIYTRRESQTTNLAVILLIQVFILAIGYLVGGIGASSSDSNGFLTYFGIVAYAAQHGLGSVFSSSAQAGGWPSSTAFYSFLLEVTNLASPQNAVQVVVISRVMFGTFDTLVIFLIVRKMYPETPFLPTYVSMFYIAGCFFIPAWFQDTSFAYTLFLLLSLLLIGFRQKASIPIFLTMVATVLANFYASVIVLGLVSADFIITRNRRYLVAYLIFLGAWNFIGYPLLYYPSFGVYYLTHFFSLGFLAAKINGSLTQGSYSHHLVVLSQLSLTLAFGAGAFASMLWLRVRGKRDMLPKPSKLIFYPILIAAIGSAAAAGFGVNPIEGLERAYIFAVPFLLIILGAGFTRRSAPFLALLVILLMPITIITTYGGVTPVYFSNSNMQGGNYLQTHWADNTFLSLTFQASTPTGGGAFIFTEGYLVLHSYTLYLNSTQIPGLSHNGKPSMVGSLAHFLEVDSQIYGVSPQYLTLANALARSANIIYSNPDTQYYLI